MATSRSLNLAIAPWRGGQPEEARGILPHQLLHRWLAQHLSPGDYRIGVVREDGLRVRIVRGEHERLITHQIDHRLGHGHPFGEVDATEDTAHLSVLDGR